LWSTINYSRYLSNDLKRVIDPVIQRNGYYGHPENLFIAMLADEKKIIRELAFRRILKARSQKIAGIRKFNIPFFNFEASDYTEIIFWQESQVTEPPLTANLSAETLRSMAESGFETGDNITLFPCHMRPVHRADNLTTFMCRLSRNLGASTTWNPRGLSRPVMGLLYLYLYRCYWHIYYGSINAVGIYIAIPVPKKCKVQNSKLTLNSFLMASSIFKC
jgi:hypothetical protein